MRRDEPLREIEWHRVVLDEAQAIKNPTTATTKAARKLKGDAPARRHRHARSRTTSASCGA